ncbi:hypothetical protein [Bacillus sp. FJAT-45350]|uniref:hypothetical protein n=1 Tax=Bacillus sp. FJAT-45350 TaxID=2011014 RepID=UPI000BB830CC|nr:hypothetical protein [Bacillus sp. FJAT-45350]
MTHEEVAGCIRIQLCYSQEEVNEWLTENGDLEIVDIKLASASFSGDLKEGVLEYESTIMVIYRSEDK